MFFNFCITLNETQLLFACRSQGGNTANAEVNKANGDSYGSKDIQEFLAKLPTKNYCTASVFEALRTEFFNAFQWINKQWFGNINTLFKLNI